MTIFRQGLFCVVLLSSHLIINAQNALLTGTPKTNVGFSDPDSLSSPPDDALGFPSRDAGLDVLPGFQNPPPGYGEVPFWWWSGDKLDKERLLWQIEELHKKGIAGMQVNYIHSDTSPWRTIMDDPKVFSEEWWDYWKFAAEQCHRLGMGIGLSGYTLDWPKKDNLFNRIIYNIPEIQGQELIADTIIGVTGGNKVTLQVSDKTIGIWAYPVKNGKITERGKDLASFLKNSTLTWDPAEGEWQVWVFTVESQPGTLNPMHPQSGENGD